MNKKIQQAKKRAVRIRSVIKGSKERPRLSIYRSNVLLSAQLIDDTMGKTLLGLSEKHMKDANPSKNSGQLGTKTEKAKAFGLFVAKKAAEKKLTTVVFDKGPYKYHGRVKSFAEGAREGGLKF